MTAENEKPEDHRSPSTWRSFGIRALVLFALVSLAVVLYWQFREVATLEYLATRESDLREYQARHPLLVYGAALLIYVTVTALSLPFAAVMTVTFGWLFDFAPAVLLASFGSVAGATLAFLSSRYIFRDAIQSRFADRLSTFNEELDRDGAFYLFTLRLLPPIPFFVINLVSGLTPIRVWTFWWVSQLGMLPGTMVFLWFGHSLPDLQTIADRGLSSVLSWQLLVALCAMGLLPLVLRLLLRWFGFSAPKKPEKGA